VDSANPRGAKPLRQTLAYEFAVFPKNRWSVNAMKQAVRLTLRALIYPEDSWWIAHCLELDVVAEGETPKKAFEALQSLTELQIETAMEVGDLQSIFRQAPPEILAAYAIAEDRRFRRKLPSRVERFDVRALQPA
jgi:predicted RNase H-like HicB family nuclease